MSGRKSKKRIGSTRRPLGQKTGGRGAEEVPSAETIPQESPEEAENAARTGDPGPPATTLVQPSSDSSEMPKCKLDLTTEEIPQDPGKTDPGESETREMKRLSEADENTSGKIRRMGSSRRGKQRFQLDDRMEDNEEMANSMPALKEECNVIVTTDEQCLTGVTDLPEVPQSSEVGSVEGEEMMEKTEDESHNERHRLLSEQDLKSEAENSSSNINSLSQSFSDSCVPDSSVNVIDTHDNEEENVLHKQDGESFQSMADGIGSGSIYGTISQDTLGEHQQQDERHERDEQKEVNEVSVVVTADVDATMVKGNLEENVLHGESGHIDKQPVETDHEFFTEVKVEATAINNFSATQDKSQDIASQAVASMFENEDHLQICADAESHNTSGHQQVSHIDQTSSTTLTQEEQELMEDVPRPKKRMGSTRRPLKGSKCVQNNEDNSQLGAETKYESTIECPEIAEETLSVKEDSQRVETAELKFTLDLATTVCMREIEVGGSGEIEEQESNQMDPILGDNMEHEANTEIPHFTDVLHDDSGSGGTSSSQFVIEASLDNNPQMNEEHTNIYQQEVVVETLHLDPSEGSVSVQPNEDEETLQTSIHHDENPTLENIQAEDECGAATQVIESEYGESKPVSGTGLLDVEESGKLQEQDTCSEVITDKPVLFGIINSDCASTPPVADHRVELAGNTLNIEDERDAKDYTKTAILDTHADEEANDSQSQSEVSSFSNKDLSEQADDVLCTLRDPGPDCGGTTVEDIAVIQNTVSSCPLQEDEIAITDVTPSVQIECSTVDSYSSDLSHSSDVEQGTQSHIVSFMPINDTDLGGSQDGQTNEPVPVEGTDKSETTTALHEQDNETTVTPQEHTAEGSVTQCATRQKRRIGSTRRKNQQVDRREETSVKDADGDNSTGALQINSNVNEDSNKRSQQVNTLHVLEENDSSIYQTDSGIVSMDFVLVEHEQCGEGSLSAEVVSSLAPGNQMEAVQDEDSPPHVAAQQPGSDDYLNPDGQQETSILRKSEEEVATVEENIIEPFAIENIYQPKKAMEELSEGVCDAHLGQRQENSITKDASEEAENDEEVSENPKDYVHTTEKSICAVTNTKPTHPGSTDEFLYEPLCVSEPEYPSASPLSDHTPEITLNVQTESLNLPVDTSGTGPLHEHDEHTLKHEDHMEESSVEHSAPRQKRKMGSTRRSKRQVDRAEEGEGMGADEDNAIKDASTHIDAGTDITVNLDKEDSVSQMAQADSEPQLQAEHDEEVSEDLNTALFVSEPTVEHASPFHISEHTPEITHSPLNMQTESFSLNLPTDTFYTGTLHAHHTEEGSVEQAAPQQKRKMGSTRRAKRHMDRAEEGEGMGADEDNAIKDASTHIDAGTDITVNLDKEDSVSQMAQVDSEPQLQAEHDEEVSEDLNKDFGDIGSPITNIKPAHPGLLDEALFVSEPTAEHASPFHISEHTPEITHSPLSVQTETFSLNLPTDTFYTGTLHTHYTEEGSVEQAAPQQKRKMGSTRRAKRHMDRAEEGESMGADEDHAIKDASTHIDAGTDITEHSDNTAKSLVNQDKEDSVNENISEQVDLTDDPWLDCPDDKMDIKDGPEKSDGGTFGPSEENLDSSSSSSDPLMKFAVPFLNVAKEKIAPEINSSDVENSNEAEQVTPSHCHISTTELFISGSVTEASEFLQGGCTKMVESHSSNSEGHDLTESRAMSDQPGLTSTHQLPTQEGDLEQNVSRPKRKMGSTRRQKRQSNDVDLDMGMKSSHESEGINWMGTSAESLQLDIHSEQISTGEEIQSACLSTPPVDEVNEYEPQDSSERLGHELIKEDVRSHDNSSQCFTEKNTEEPTFFMVQTESEPQLISSLDQNDVNIDADVAASSEAAQAETEGGQCQEDSAEEPEQYETDINKVQRREEDKNDGEAGGKEEIHKNAEPEQPKLVLKQEMGETQMVKDFSPSDNLADIHMHDRSSEHTETTMENLSPEKGVTASPYQETEGSPSVTRRRKMGSSRRHRNQQETAERKCVVMDGMLVCAEADMSSCPANESLGGKTEETQQENIHHEEENKEAMPSISVNTLSESLTASQDRSCSELRGKDELSKTEKDVLATSIAVVQVPLGDSDSSVKDSMYGVDDKSLSSDNTHLSQPESSDSTEQSNTWKESQVHTATTEQSEMTDSIGITAAEATDHSKLCPNDCEEAPKSPLQKRKIGSSRRGQGLGKRGKRDVTKVHGDTDIINTESLESHDKTPGALLPDVGSSEEGDSSSVTPQDNTKDLSVEGEQPLAGAGQAGERGLQEQTPEESIDKQELSAAVQGEPPVLTILSPIPPEGHQDNPTTDPQTTSTKKRKMGSTRRNTRRQDREEESDSQTGVTERPDDDNSSQQDVAIDTVTVTEIEDLEDSRPTESSAGLDTAGQTGTPQTTRRKMGSRRAGQGYRGIGVYGEPEDQAVGTDQGGDSSTSPMAHEKPLSGSGAEGGPSKVTPAGEGDRRRRVEQPDPSAARRKSDLDRMHGQDYTLTSLEEAIMFNVVMVGESSVGKTSFVKRLMTGQYSEDHSATIGVDTFIQTLAVDGKLVKLQIWDTAGQERFHSITRQVLHKAQGLILMYDISSCQTFSAVRRWISCVEEGAPHEVIIMLLGNKSDSKERQVLHPEGERLAQEYNIHFMECSAATGYNVSLAMENLARLLRQTVKDSGNENLSLHKPQQKKSGCC